MGQSRSSWQNKKTRALFEAVLTLRSTGECSKFFRDLLTEDEISEFSNRWQTVQLLEKGLSYREINQLNGVSTATITRIAKWYREGCGGYKLAAKRVSQEKSRTG